MLRMAVPNEALAYEFSITSGRVSQTFDEWIYAMARKLSQLIVRMARLANDNKNFTKLF